MKKQILGLVAASLMISTPALADENVTSKFKLSIYGFIKLDYAYNSVDLGDNAGMLLPSSGLIPKTSSLQFKRDQSTFTARQSRFGFKIAGPEMMGAKTSALVEADFYGDYVSGNQATESPTLRMRMAWGAVDWTNTQILFGQAYDIFGPMIASTIDFRSGAGWGTPNTPRVPQLRVTQKYNMDDNNTLTMVLGVQNPSQDFGAAGNNAFTGSMVNGAGQLMFSSKAMGVSPGYFGLGNKPLTVGLFGLYGNQKVDYTIVNQQVDSWGYGFYTFIPILKSADGKGRKGTASFEGQIYEAANMSFNTATPVATLAATNTGNIYANVNPAKAFGIGAQLIVYPTQELGITAGYGFRGAINAEDYRGTNNYSNSNYQLYLSAAYDFNAAVRLAAEYQYARTNYGNPSVNTSDFGFVNIGRVAAFYFF